METTLKKCGRTWLRSCTALLACALLVAATPATAAKKGRTKAPVFTKFSYEGHDAVYDANPLEAGEFYSPILQGCYPDPSITRKGGDYYLVCSSFAMYPGVPIFHSTDLVNWKQLGHVLERESQLKVADCGISMGVYAPAIAYNPANDTFYMITTQFSGGFGNIVVKTKDPAKGWSDPVKLQFDGIDPSLFFDDDGRAYVVHNDAPPQGKALYEGHRVIKIWDYDTENDQVVAGTDRIIVDGGTDIRRKPIWIEGPHMYKKNGRYYLMCAEGGTGADHSEVIFVGDSPKGPFTPAPNNPILSQRHLAKDRPDKVDWAGHADLVEGPDGKYYGVFLAVRPNEKGQVNTGRETFILPVDWSGDFPVFENGLVPLACKQKMPAGTVNRCGQDGFLPNGNFTFEDQFKQFPLDMRWIGLRGPREQFAKAAKGGGLEIAPSATHIKEVKPTSTLFYRQQHRAFTATTTLDFTPQKADEMAGIVCYQSEAFHYVMGVTRTDEACMLVLARTEQGRTSVVAATTVDTARPLTLQVTAEGNAYRFNYAEGDSALQNLGGTVAGDVLSTDVAGGFTGALIGLYATTANDIRP